MQRLRNAASSVSNAARSVCGSIGYAATSVYNFNKEIVIKYVLPNNKINIVRLMLTNGFIAAIDTVIPLGIGTVAAANLSGQDAEIGGKTWSSPYIITGITVLLCIRNKANNDLNRLKLVIPTHPFKKMVAQIADHALRGSPQDKTDPGTAAGYIQRGCGGIAAVPRNMCTNLIPSSFNIIALMIFLGDPLTSAILFAAAVGCVKYNFARADEMTKLTKRARDANNVSYDDVLKAFAVASDIQRVNKIKFEAKKINNTLNECVNADLASNYRINQIEVYQQYFLNAMLGVILFLSGIRLNSGELTPAKFVAIPALLPPLINSFTSLASFFLKLINDMGDVNFALDFLKKAATIPDRFPNNELQIENGNVVIEFKNISFGHPNKALLLTHFSNIIQPGEIIGMAGMSGQGKSTLFNLLYRFLEPNDGTITIGEKDISQFSMESVRRLIAYAPQAPVLLGNTIYDCLNYGSPDGNLRKEEAWELIRLVGLEEYVSKLPNGLDEVVTDKISGGEKQRLAIAVALAKKPKILMLDEATTGLDALIENAFFARLFDYAKTEKIVLILSSHNLKNFVGTNKIFVVADGKVTVDTHESLLDPVKGNKVYQTLWQENMKKMDLANPADEKGNGNDRFQLPSLKSSSTVFAINNPARANAGVVAKPAEPEPLVVVIHRMET